MPYKQNFNFVYIVQDVYQRWKYEIKFQHYNILTARGKSRPHPKMPQKLQKTDKNVASYVIPKSTVLAPDKKLGSKPNRISNN